MNLLRPALIGFSLGALLALCLSGCGTVSPVLQRTQADIDQALNDLADVAVADLQGALADAQGKQDIEAAQCYGGLIPIVQALQAAKQAGGGTIVMPKGAFMVFQGTRDIVRGALGVTTVGGVGPSLLARINIACTPLIASMNVDLLKAAATVGGIMSGIGAAPGVVNALKGIGPLLKLLPLPIPLG
jgi:hypothetical protein